MDIVGSELAFSAERHYSRTQFRQDGLRLQGSAAATSPGTGTGSGGNRASISPEARRLVIAPPPPLPALPEPGDTLLTEALASAEEAARNDPNLRFLIELIEAFLGRPLRLDGQTADASPEPPAADPAPPAPAAAAPAPAPAGVELRRTEILQESELTRFQARGVVRTADGQKIQFELALEMERHYREVSSTRISLGAEPPRKDPLVLNFAGSAAQLRDQRFEFDLDSDGRSDSLAQLASGSGFLVFDRNNNGRADDGSELFGARSGDGFADLARLDGDGNGWIDAGDAAFARLRLWTPASNGGGRWSTLAERGVEAIATANIATEFGLRGQGNRDLGQIRATGIYLGSAGVGTAQQVDLSA